MVFRYSRAVMAAALMFSTGACQAWRVDKRPVPVVIEDNAAGPVAVTMTDLRWVVLANPRLANDSIIGIRTEGNTFGKGRTALPLGGVRSVETRKFSLLRTFYLAAAAAFIPTLYRLALIEEE